MKLNNKGYLLIEIILAFAIAFGLAFFIIDLVLRLKNKNDDLMVETLINTDKTIITNKLMDYAKEDPEGFDCSKLTKEGNTIKYNGNIIDNVNEYTKIKELTCTNNGGKITIKVPLEVPQQPDKDYDINLDYKYQIGDMTPPTCSLTLGANGLITATYQDNDGGSGVAYYGFSSSYTGDSSNSKNISSVGNYTYYVKDRAGNTSSCKIDIKNIIQNKTCPSGYTDNGSQCVKTYKACPDEYTDNGSGTCWKYIGNPVNGTQSWSGVRASANCVSNCQVPCSCTDTGTNHGEQLQTCFCSNTGKKCNSGTLNGNYCYDYRGLIDKTITESYSTSISCSSGYTKTTDNLYCYK